MRARILKRKSWVCAILIVLAVLLGARLKTAFDVASVQDAVQRDWEIEFGPVSQPRKPAMLPEFLDAAVWDYLFTHYRDPADPNAPAKARNRNAVYYTRFLSLFRGPIREIHIHDFEAFHGDLGAALARFPNMRRVSVFDSGLDLPTESEWTSFCTRLRALPRLEEIELGGAWVTDRAIAPLAGHPHVRTLSIRYGRLTTDSTKTFASLPRLATLRIKDQMHEGEASISSANHAAMTSALPSVIIEFP